MQGSQSKCSALVVVALLMLLGSAPTSRAGLAVSPSCDGACTGTLKAWLPAERSKWFPVLNGPAERFDEEGKAECPARQNVQPVVHAIVLAPFYDHFLQLPGTQN